MSGDIIATAMKDYEKDILHSLLMLGLIHEDFTGSITIHFNQGGITDYEKLEKGMKKRIK